MKNLQDSCRRSGRQAEWHVCCCSGQGGGRDKLSQQLLIVDVLWHSSSFPGVLWSRWTGSGGECSQGIQHCCSWAHSSHCASGCGKAAALSELPRHMQRWNLHCLLLLCFCNINNSSTAMKNIKESISRYWPPRLINIPSTFPCLAPEITSQTSMRS